jgi:predicted glycoside hydrolase/deacetylase ChbG (UPF0249 family)
MQIIINADEIEEAIEISKKLVNISFGIHLALTDNFKSLTNGKKFNKSNWYFNKLNIFKLANIIKEFSLQIEKLQNYGINISHIDIYVAKKYKITKIRTQVLCDNSKKLNKLYRSCHNLVLKSFKFKLMKCYTELLKRKIFDEA